MTSRDLPRLSKAKQFVVTIVISLATASAVSAQTAVNLVDLIGKKRSELTGVFPGADFVIKEWRGWDNVLLVPGREGRLLGLLLQPRSPISEQEAEDAVRQLGVSVDVSKYFSGPSEHRIKTVLRSDMRSRAAF